MFTLAWQCTVADTSLPTRSCIGYRFALVEFKCLLFSLVRAFSFELADPSVEIGKKSNVVTRPMIVSEPDQGAQLPLKITPWRGA